MLPKIQSMIYEVEIPTLKNKVKFRPFLVKEFKSLLQAQEFGDDVGFINTVRDILTECTFNIIDIDSLSVYLIDYLFLMIRAKSVGEIIDAEYICHNMVSDVSKVPKIDFDKLFNNLDKSNKIEIEKHEKEENVNSEIVENVECNNRFKIQFSLMDTFIKFPEDYNKKCIIQINDLVGIRLRSPTFGKFKKIGLTGKDMFSVTDDYIFSCVDCVYDGDKILQPGVDFSLEELKEFVNNFPSDKIQQITDFFKAQPSVCLALKITCPKCRNENRIELTSIKDFFD